MFVDNRTDFRPRSMVARINDVRSVACLTLRVAYTLNNGQLERAEIVSEPGGQIGASPLCVGSSWSLAGTAETARANTMILEAAVRVGAREPVDVTVVGDRVWEKRGGSLQPSSPQRFERMPLGAERAFGGTVILPAGERNGLPHPALNIPHGVNPRGRGFVLDQAMGEGVALPNVELSDDRLRGWPHQPDAAVLAPEPNEMAPRLSRTAEHVEGREAEEHLQILHPCHRRAFGPPLQPGCQFALTGFRPEGLVFALPPSPVRVQLRQNRAWHKVGHHIRHVHIHLDHQRIEVLFGHSASFGNANSITDARVEKAA